MNFAQRLVALMDRDGMTRYELSKRLDIHPTTITNWIDGRSLPRMKTQRTLSQLFGVSVDYLMGNEDEERELVNNDPELTEYLEELKSNPEMRMLFKVTKGATKDDVKKAVEIIKAFLKKD